MSFEIFFNFVTLTILCTDIIINIQSTNHIFSERLACEEIRRNSKLAPEIRHIEGILLWLEENASSKCSQNYYSSSIANENTLHSVKLGEGFRGEMKIGDFYSIKLWGPPPFSFGTHKFQPQIRLKNLEKLFHCEIKHIMFSNRWR